MGHVGHFQAVDAVCYPRRARVVVRTRRGLELGEILAEPSAETNDALADGAILRGVTVEDELLQSRLEKNRQEAYQACSDLISKHNLSSVLIDVEHLFDGQGLFFYFLGEVTLELENLTQQLAEAYETKVQFRQFTETLIEGCGPDCGTEAAAGQGGCDSCSGCAVATACNSR